MKKRIALFIFSMFSVSSFSEYRTYDGYGNNLSHPTWGAAGQPMARLTFPDYSDGIGEPGGTNRPNPRTISNALIHQQGLIRNTAYFSDYVWIWGQFIDHNITFILDNGEEAPIPIPAGDPRFDPMGTGTQTMHFVRSMAAPGTGISSNAPRQQINALTSFIDAAGVYGATSNRAHGLRSLTDGKLLERPDGLLPLQTNGLANVNPGPLPDSLMTLAGDLRANEHTGLTAIHTLWLREHNRWCDVLAALHPGWDDETLYQEARKRVAALIQIITYQEFLPALLGSHAPEATGQYNSNINPTIVHEFSTVLYRMGHTLVSPIMMRVDNNNQHIPEGPLALRDAFFNPTHVDTSKEFDWFMKGFAARRQQQYDAKINEEMRNFLFQLPNGVGFDLATFNIQRGREHGVPDYNTVRQAYGLTPKQTFAEITTNVALQTALQTTYGSIDLIDPWVGALSEDPYSDSILGELLTIGIADQFTRLRDGDRFWFEFPDAGFTPQEISALRNTTLSDVIKRNSSITRLQNNVFFVIPEPVLEAEYHYHPNRGIMLQWQGNSNATYQVQYTDSLQMETNQWQDIGPAFKDIANGFLFEDDDFTPGRRFYRIKQLP